MPMNEKDFFEHLKKDKKKLLSDMNKLIYNFEEKYKHIEIHEFRHAKFFGKEEDYTNFIRFIEIIMSFSLETIKDRDKRNQIKTKGEKNEPNEPKRG